MSQSSRTLPDYVLVAIFFSALFYIAIGQKYPGIVGIVLMFWTGSFYTFLIWLWKKRRE